MRSCSWIPPFCVPSRGSIGPTCFSVCRSIPRWPANVKTALKPLQAFCSRLRLMRARFRLIWMRRLARPGLIPTPWHSADYVSRPLVDDAPVRRVRHRRGDATRATASCWSKARPACRVAFDLPTQIGYDADDPMALGEVGKVGVSISSVDDMARAVRRHSAGQGLDQHDHQRAGGGAAGDVHRRRPGARASPESQLRGTVQNDILKEYIARGTYIFPPQPSMRLITDLFAYCSEHVPQLEHHQHQRLSHPRGGLAPPCRKWPSRWPTASPTCRRRSTPGWTSTTSRRSCRSSSTRTTTFLEEVAKFRAARRLWARIMRERFGAQNPRKLDAALPHADRRQHADGAAAG